MKKIYSCNSTVILIIVATIFPYHVQAESVLRITCDDTSDGAKIFLNSKYRGRCPSDLFVKSGKIKLRAVKNVDPIHERVFETIFQLENNSAKRIEILLSQPRLTKAGILKQKILDSEMAKRKAEAQLFLGKKDAKVQLLLAQKGNVGAMKNMIQYYKIGYGVKKDMSKSMYWSNKITKQLSENVLKGAEKGDLNSMWNLSLYYHKGAEGFPKDSKKAKYWFKKAQELALQ